MGRNKAVTPVFISEMAQTRITILLILICCPVGFALEPEEILVIANSDVPSSVWIAHYYCKKRDIPADNLIAWPLGKRPRIRISRNDYERKLAEPLRGRLTASKFAGKIKCLLTTYGVPLIVGGRGQLEGRQSDLKRLQELLEQEKGKIKQLEQNDSAGDKQVSIEKKKIQANVAKLQSRIDSIIGKETSASVDSELSMVLFRNYELYRWQPNRLMKGATYLDINSLMVCRLDGPGEDIIMGLIDKAISTEQADLKGIAYIDSRDIPRERDLFGYYDQSLRDLALLTKLKTELTVKEERTAKLFSPGSCPRTAIYCGWYSLGKYVDAFNFVDGAIGYHIASLEAAGLRDPNSSQWCPSLLRDGITATLGAVAEPYLHSFPQPRAFFMELYEGSCLVEAYYRTKPFNSWQLLLIGDPLYKPFKKRLD
jgi:uncharacterized protein (TIGR03790 family)